MAASEIIQELWKNYIDRIEEATNIFEESERETDEQKIDSVLNYTKEVVDALDSFVEDINTELEKLEMVTAPMEGLAAVFLYGHITRHTSSAFEEAIRSLVEGNLEKFEAYSLYISQVREALNEYKENIEIILQEDGINAALLAMKALVSYADNLSKAQENFASA